MHEILMSYSDGLQRSAASSYQGMVESLMATGTVVKHGSRCYRIKKWSFAHRAFFRAFQASLSYFIASRFRFEAIGTEHLENFPEGVPVIFAGNHRSHLDALVLGAAITPPWGKKRYLASIAPAKTMKENTLFRLTRYIGTYPLDRDNPEPALDYFYETIKAGLGIFIFPQGGRIARTPVQDYQSFLKEGRTGVGRLVLSLNGEVPVIPFYIHGSAEALGHGSLQPRFTSYLSVKFGEPIAFDQYRREQGWSEGEEFYSTAREITNHIMQEIRQLLYETEEGLFKLIESKLKTSVEKLTLTEGQERQLRRTLRKLAYLSPEEIATKVN